MPLVEVGPMDLGVGIMIGFFRLVRKNLDRSNLVYPSFEGLFLVNFKGQRSPLARLMPTPRLVFGR